MTLFANLNTKPGPGPKVLTLEEVRSRMKPGAIVLWPYRGSVEEGTVQFCVNDQKVAVIWLEGYRSRNDDVPLDEILSVHDKKGPEMALSVFSGKGYYTEAGVRWWTAEQAAKAAKAAETPA